MGISVSNNYITENLIHEKKKIKLVKKSGSAPNTP